MLAVCRLKSPCDSCLSDVRSLPVSVTSSWSGVVDGDWERIDGVRVGAGQSGVGRKAKSGQARQGGEKTNSNRPRPASPSAVSAAQPSTRRDEAALSSVSPLPRPGPSEASIREARQTIRAGRKDRHWPPRCSPKSRCSRQQTF